MPSAAAAVPSTLPFALALAALAGAVDAIAVAGVGDIYVSFMSGNTTQLGMAVGTLAGGGVWRIAVVVLVFVLGVVFGELIATPLAPGRRSAVLLGAVALVLGAAASLAHASAARLAVSATLAFAMGLQNAVLRRAGQLDVAVTYVTGTLVRLSRAIAAALAHRGPWREAWPFAGLWFAFAAGAAAGGLASAAGTVVAIGGTAVVAASLSLASLRPRRAAPELS